MKVKDRPQNSSNFFFHWVNKVLVQSMRKHQERLDHCSAAPVQVQDELLRSLLEQGAKTFYGKKYHFHTLSSAASFRSEVPLITYAELKPYVDRQRAGEKNILWPGKTEWYAKSSGTATGTSKFLPVTTAAIEDCHFSGGRYELALLARLRPDTRIFEGLALRLGGSTTVDSNPQVAAASGDLSAIMIKNLPLWAELRSAPRQSTAVMSNWEEKIDAIADEAIASNITSLWGVSSWFLVLFHKVLEKSGASNLLELWPNLELFAHGGVNFAPYEAQFRALMPGDQVLFLENYNASEGFFAVQDRENQEGLLLLLDNGVYYEFIPMSQYKGTNSEAIGLEDVAIGVEYALVITTNAGLWRYLIGDTVRFVSLDPHRIVVSGRTAHFINAFGEELIVSDAEHALARACAVHQCGINDFHAAPFFIERGQKGRHQWIVEFERPPADLAAFCTTLDAELRRENSDYDAKRTGDLVLSELELIAAPTGLFHQWLSRKGKLGGQNKIPRLKNDRVLLEEFLALMPK